MGRDTHLSNFSGVLQKVSTHAPAWGATKGKWINTSRQHVSTHAPAWGATYHDQYEDKYDRVSTHAPAWGATHLKHD